MEANLGLIFTNKYNEVAKYVTQNVNLWPFPTVLVINLDKYKSLSASQRKVLRDAAAPLAAYSINIFLKPAKGATNFVTALCDEGIKYAFASKSQLSALQNAFKPAYAQLQKDPQTKAYISQIQAVAKSHATAAGPARAAGQVHLHGHEVAPSAFPARPRGGRAGRLTPARTAPWPGAGAPAARPRPGRRAWPRPPRAVGPPDRGRR